MSKLDPRLNPYRPDLAAEHLKDEVEAARYTSGELRHVTSASTPLRRAPTNEAPLDTEALTGELVTVFEDAKGWSWVQLNRDGYVGYLRTDALCHGPSLTSHRIKVPRTYLFREPDIKTPPKDTLFLNAEMCLCPADGDFVELKDEGFIYAHHAATVRQLADDFVAVAVQFISTPYLWGGKTALGIDCSGLLQVAMQAAGLECPRDSDMQMSSVGQPISNLTDASELQRGDLVFWKGHVGIMVDHARLLHANAFHMMAVVETLEEAVRRIAKQGSEIAAIKRLPALAKPARTQPVAFQETRRAS